jgi:chloride channel 3/4/5
MVFSLLIATILRVFLVIISYGCKVPAGIFVPSMAIGASFGRMVGILVKALHDSFPDSAFFASCEPDVPCITPGTYAFLGAAAALSGIMHLTVSVVVIMFELTGALTYILPTMVSFAFVYHQISYLTSFRSWLVSPKPLVIVSEKAALQIE